MINRVVSQQAIKVQRRSIMNEHVRDRGREWERYFFGLERNIPFTQVPYLEYEVALMEVLKMQVSVFGLNPEYPTKGMTKSLVACAREFLVHLQKPHNEKLRLYCALGTALDLCHGIDGFFMLGNRRPVTFDLSARLQGSKTSRKADIIIERNRCKNYEMWRIAKEIAEKL